MDGPAYIPEARTALLKLEGGLSHTAPHSARLRIAQSVGEDGDKIRRLLGAWVEKAVLTNQEAEEIASLMSAKDLPSPQAGRLLQQVGVQMGHWARK